MTINSPLTHEKQRRNTLWFLLYACLLFFVFRTACATLWKSWNKEEYSYGYLIPFLSLLLFLNKMAEMPVVARPAPVGAFIIIVGMVVQFGLGTVGIYGLMPSVLYVSFLGLVLLFWGRAITLRQGAPLGLLFFCIPLPKFIYLALSFKMRMLSSTLGTAVLSLIGIPVFQDGNILDLGNYKLDVAEACNGLRYLFPLLAIGFFLAAEFKAPFWKRALLFLSGVPIAVIVNGLRIAFIGVTVSQWGPSMAEGTLHEVEGMIFFIGCIGIFLLEIKLFSGFGQVGALDFDCLRLPSLKQYIPPVWGRAAQFTLVILVVAAIASASFPLFFSQYIKPVPLQQTFEKFPLQIGAWVGKLEPLEPAIVGSLATKDYFLADYTKDGKNYVSLYILYYPQQDGADTQTTHSPLYCIPGGGGTILSNAEITVTLKNLSPLRANRLVVEGGGIHSLLYFWYVLDGHPLVDPLLSKLSLVKHAVVTGRTPGAVIRVLTPLPPGDNEAEAEKRMTEFMNDALPVLNHFMFPH